MKKLLYVAPVLALLTGPLAAASIQGAKPEEVGFSSERLARIQQTVKRHIDAHDIAGAVTLVARRGRIAQCIGSLPCFKTSSSGNLLMDKNLTKQFTCRTGCYDRLIPPRLGFWPDAGKAPCRNSRHLSARFVSAFLRSIFARASSERKA